MSTTDWQRLQDLFEDARRLAPGERSAFLEQACGDDERLRERLARMLRADERSELEPPETDELTRSLAPAERAGRRVGRYELIREVGRGGMATVYLARRVDGHFEKDVALKLIRRGLDTDDLVERFRLERQVLAGLEHPGIARLLDGGSTEEGLPFLVMEYVDGVPLDAYCDGNRLNVRQRVDLIRRVCEAVQHAHEAHVVHRDLKPSNVIVSADGEPRLLDFGIARILDADGEVATAARTATERRLLTPEYASPEQVLGGRVTPASDVYSLGVMLFRSLTGRSPYGETAVSRSDLEQRICREDPPLASTWSASGGAEAATLRGESTTRALRRELAGDLDNVLATALRKEPERRYRSAAALADDLARWLRDEPVRARPSTWLYRTRKFTLRHRALVASSLALLLALSLGLATSLTLFFESERQRGLAERQSYVGRVAAAEAALRNGDIVDARRNLQLADAGHRGWEWRHLMSRARDDATTFEVEGSWFMDVAWSASGDRLAAIGRYGRLVVLESATGAEVRRWEALGAYCDSLAFDPGGERAVVSTSDGGVLALDVADGTSLWQHAAPRGNLRSDRTGERLVLAHPDGVEVLDFATGERLQHLALAGQGVLAAAFAEPGSEVFLCTQAGRLAAWDTATGALRDVAHLAEHFRPQDLVQHHAFDVARGRLAVGASDGHLRFFDAASGALENDVAAHGDLIVCVRFDRAGERVVTNGIGGEVHLWSGVEGRLLRRFTGHRSNAQHAEFDARGERLATVGWDGALKIWDPHEVSEVLAFDRGARMALAIDPAGERLAVARWASWGGAERGVSVIDIASRRELWHTQEAIPGAESLANSANLVWHPDGTRLYGHLHGEHLFVWDAGDGSVLARWPTGTYIQALAISPDGALLAVGHSEVRLLDATTGEEVARTGEDLVVRGLAFDPAGELLAIHGERTPAVLYDWRRGVNALELPVAPNQVQGIAFHPDGERFATSEAGGRVRLWRLAPLTELRVWSGREFAARDLAFHADGTRLFTVAHDGLIRLWDPEHDGEVATLRGHRASLEELALSPDGSLLVTQDTNGQVRFWPAPPAE